MPIPVERGKHKRALLRDDVYSSLRDAIIDGTLVPGERLRDPELADWLGVSRTPIREAVARLEAAGLVQTMPGRYTIVSRVENKAILDAQEVAAAMHELAVRLAVPRITGPELAAMEQANTRFAEALDTGDVDAALDSDTDFHGVTVRASRNDVIASVLEQVTPLLRRAERLRFSSLSGRDSIAQHRRIIDLCRAGDSHGAALAARENWETLASLIEPA